MTTTNTDDPLDILYRAHAASTGDLFTTSDKERNDESEKNDSAG